MFQMTSESLGKQCELHLRVFDSVPSRRTGMSKSTASVDCRLDSWNLQLTTACRSQMPVTGNAGDWLAEIDQVSRSHAVSTLVSTHECTGGT